MKERIIQELMESISSSEDAIYGIQGAAERIEQIVLEFNATNIHSLQKRIDNLHQLVKEKDDVLKLVNKNLSSEIKRAIEFIIENPEREEFLEDCQQKDIENNVINLEQAEEINWEHWDNQYHLVLKFLKTIPVR